MKTNYKYQVLQATKRLSTQEYKDYKFIGEFLSMREAMKCFNQHKKRIEDNLDFRRFYQQTIIVRVYNDDEFNENVEVVEITEYQFNGLKGSRM